MGSSFGFIKYEKNLSNWAAQVFQTSMKQLFQFGFFVQYMFTHYWIKFFDFEFARHGAFVFGSGVKMASTSRGFQFDFVAHCSILKSQYD